LLESIPMALPWPQVWLRESAVCRRVTSALNIRDPFWLQA